MQKPGASLFCLSIAVLGVIHSCVYHDFPEYVCEEEFTFDDFLAQMAAVKQMGSLKKMLGMMPGMVQMKAQLDSIGHRQVDGVYHLGDLV